MMKVIIFSVALHFVAVVSGQGFSFIKASEHFSIGTAAGLANMLASNTTNPRVIEFHTSVDFGLTSANFFYVSSNFKGWKSKTQRQKRMAVINSIIYIGIGLGARHLAIKYSTALSHK